ncbi:MAG: SpoIIE family protein phosphatase [Bacteroidales bacterium]|nr:SpoIIE family protein phosphatase [Bacteroidales bacterium]MBN2698700.1 SpoIIE family protein phosphatase [Bacteroidales bacterium]
MRVEEAERTIRLNLRRIILITLIGFLVVVLFWIMAIMEQNQPVTFAAISRLHSDHPVYFIYDLLPLFIFLFLYPVHRITGHIILDYARQVREYHHSIERHTSFAKELSEGSDPELFDEMMKTELGQSLRLIQLNIKSNRRRDHEQTWIAEGKEILSRILRSHTDFKELSDHVLSWLNNYIQSVQGAVYLYDEEKELLLNIGTHAYNRRKFIDQEIRIGEGLVGQCAFEMDYIYRTEIPGDYITITSGLLGERKPSAILLIPLVTDNVLQGVMEFAFLDPKVPKLTIQLLLELGEIIARTLYNLKVTRRTENLLEESRRMTEELRRNEKSLQESAMTMERTQDELKEANIQLQSKIEEAQNASNRLQWVLENASEIISIYDRELKLIYISPAVRKILGFTEEEMMDGNDLQRIGREVAALLRKTLHRLLEEPDRILEIEYPFIKRNGDTIHLRAICHNRFSDPSLKGFVLNTTDITQSKQVEKEQRLKTRMQSLSENSLDLIFRISTGGTIHYVNPIAEDYTHISPGSMLNKPLDDIPLSREFSEFFKATLYAMNSEPLKKNTQLTVPLRLGDTVSERIISFDAIPEFQDGELETILFVGHDITEVKKIEKEIKIKNTKIQDSINYAERIQSSILPEIRRIRSAFPDCFVFYRARDVISGDFPWFFETEDAVFIAAVDCTGHGVPGALLSFVGFFLLNNITALNPGSSPAQICDALHSEVRQTLKQDSGQSNAMDGMDLALCKIFRKERILEFAGAHRPLLHLSEGELTVYKGERKAIGGFQKAGKQEEPFTNYRMEYRRGDKILIFTDGLTDQLGGEKGLKYGTERIRRILLENTGLSIPRIEAYIQHDFSNWMGSEPQLDDVLLIGIEL